jgi:hypothetical protein
MVQTEGQYSLIYSVMNTILLQQKVRENWKEKEETEKKEEKEEKENDSNNNNNNNKGKRKKAEKRTTSQKDLWEQVAVDVLRTIPTGWEVLFGHEAVKHSLKRVLFLYSLHEQTGNYWQGLNELPAPFLVTFLAFFMERQPSELNNLSDAQLEEQLGWGNPVEADLFGCLTQLVLGLQEEQQYVVEKHGTIAEKHMLQKLRDVLFIIDRKLERLSSFTCKWYIPYANV